MARISVWLASAVLLAGAAGAWGEGLFPAPLPETISLSEDGSQLCQEGKSTPGLYDVTVLRTLNLTFEQEDWWDQLTANYSTGEDLPADLTVDGVTYRSVGVRFRGNTSYSRIGNSQKKSFNISIDYADPDQRLMGYRTLNLNNARAFIAHLQERETRYESHSITPELAGGLSPYTIHGHVRSLKTFATWLTAQTDETVHEFRACRPPVGVKRR